MSKVLVTGGAGFIGSHTCLGLLKEGYEVVVIDSLVNSSHKSLERVLEISKKENFFNKENLIFIKGDLRDKKLLDQTFNDFQENGEPINSVIHFAGLKAVNDSLNLPIRYWDSNVNGTISLLNTMDKYDCKTIIFSSSATIYEASNNLIVNEDTKLNPKNPYGSTKLVIEYLLNDIFKSKSTEWKIVNLRYFNPIGAHPSGLIGEFPLGIPSNIFPSITQVASKKLRKLNIFGNDWPTADGTCIRDFIHVMDLVDGHIAALKFLDKNKPQIKKFNLGTGLGTSVLELIETFQKVNNIEIPYCFLPRREGDLVKVVADNSLAIKYLKWKAKRNIEDMCRDGWKWQLLNPNGYH